MRSPAVRADVARCTLGVMVIDIDNLKEVNARFGHGAGDAVICHVADRLRSMCGPLDLVGRSGGDEFTVICRGTDRLALHGCGGGACAAACSPFNGRIAASMSAHASAPVWAGARPMRRGSDPAGRDRARRLEGARTGIVVHYTDDMGRAQQARQQLAQDLEEAVRADQFEVYLQPQLNLGDDTISGCEALIRWRHPRRGVLSPAAFMDMATRIGLVADIDTGWR